MRESLEHQPTVVRNKRGLSINGTRITLVASVVPWTITFMAWYLAYVACCNWARGFMSHRIGDSHINVALIFGLLQFVSTFVIAALYGRFANRKLDPLAHGLNAKYKRERRR